MTALNLSFALGVEKKSIGKTGKEPLDPPQPKGGGHERLNKSIADTS